jgi:hypothetical protein
VQRVEVSGNLGVSAQLAEVRALLGDEATPAAETESTPPAAEADAGAQAESANRDKAE